MRSYSFTAGDKDYTARYDFNAIADMEEMANKPIQVIMGEGTGFHSFRLLIWGGLKWKDAGITKQRAGMILNKLTEEGGKEKLDEVIKNLVVLLAKAVNPDLTEEEMAEMLDSDGEEKNV
jgi:hypothetical protein